MVDKNNYFERMASMTDHQADSARSDLIDLIIEKVRRIVKDANQQDELINELKGLKKEKPQ